MKKIFENVCRPVIEFYEPIPLLINAIITTYCVYQMYYYAHSGFLGIIGVGIFALFSASVLIVVNNYLSELRIRSFVLSSVIIAGFFVYLIPVCLDSKPPHDAVIKEAIQASSSS